ncbi:MAG: phosphate/phosphite/phosphonate ABC transporter substrate-binding protein [Syntrophus sp. (in: bacteria)]
MKKGKKWIMKNRIFLICIALILLLGAGAAQAQEAFVIGVAPHSSARVILEMYQPLRLYLEKALGTPVEVVTAPDFNKFAKRGLEQAYDIAITTSHQARLFQTDARYIPLLTYKADFKAVALVAAKGPIRKPIDLKGKKILGLSPSSQVTLWGQHWLADHGVSPVSIQYVSASDSVAQLVSSGEAAAGFTSLANFQKLAPNMQKQLRILDQSKSMPGRVYVLNSKRSAEKKKIEAALWGFAGTPAGRQYFEANKLEGYRKLRPRELNAMDVYAAEVRKVLHDTTE